VALQVFEVEQAACKKVEEITTQLSVIWPKHVVLPFLTATIDLNSVVSSGPINMIKLKYQATQSTDNRLRFGCANMQYSHASTTNNA
jgi:hypothetical protein